MYMRKNLICKIQISITLLILYKNAKRVVYLPGFVAFINEIVNILVSSNSKF